MTGLPRGGLGRMRSANVPRTEGRSAEVDLPLPNRLPASAQAAAYVAVHTSGGLERLPVAHEDLPDGHAGAHVRTRPARTGCRRAWSCPGAAPPGAKAWAAVAAASATVLIGFEMVLY
ncbi:hypothetical protein SCALM49S_04328 [Streptomyces californicus]